MPRRGRPRPAPAAWAAAIGVLLAVLAGGEARAQTGSLEYAIKATYLYKFGPFIDWPPGAFASPASPLVLCVVGGDPFGDTLDHAVSGQLVEGRPIIVRRLGTVDRSSGCHIAYLTGSPAQSPADALAALHGAPALTVTDGARDARDRGIVNFVILDNRVRFQIDGTAAAANGIAVSSKLRSLAVPIEPGRE